MRLTLDALAVLDAIDRKGSFAAAAEELYRVPSAITYTVQKLEQDLGVTVFDRGGHRARLTPAGQKLLGEGRRLLSLAEQLERAVKRVATGWEAELSIAVNDIIPLERLYPLLEDFYQEEHGTRLRITNEVLGGVWDALVSGRVDLAIGAPVEGPPGGGYASRPMGFMTFVFVVAPQHPLADIPEPLADETILQYRAVATADSSRNLPPRTSALFSGQDVLTVPNMEAKCEAHRRGLGVGYVPRHLVQEDLTSGRLIAKAVAGDIPIPRLSVAWRTARVGKALKWFLRRLEEPELLQEIMD
jgi:DNA-binding transcriptional LysR family regulator